MMNDIHMEMKIRWWKRQELYKPSANLTVPVKFRRDDYGNGPDPTSAIRMLGKSGCCSDDQYKAIASSLEDLLAGEGPCGSWPADMLGNWLNDIHVTQYEDMQISLFHYVALTTGTYPRLETRGKGAGEIDNNMFVVELPLLDDEHEIIPHAPVNAETLWGVDKFPPVHAYDTRPLLPRILLPGNARFRVTSCLSAWLRILVAILRLYFPPTHNVELGKDFFRRYT